MGVKSPQSPVPVLKMGYRVDTESEPARDREPMTITEVYLGQVTVEDFRRNPRGELGTRTATLHKKGIRRFRENRVYRVDSPRFGE